MPYNNICFPSPIHNHRKVISFVRGKPGGYHYHKVLLSSGKTSVSTVFTRHQAHLFTRGHILTNSLHHCILPPPPRVAVFTTIVWPGVREMSVTCKQTNNSKDADYSTKCSMVEIHVQSQTTHHALQNDNN